MLKPSFAFAAVALCALSACGSSDTAKPAAALAPGGGSFQTIADRSPAGVSSGELQDGAVVADRVFFDYDSAAISENARPRVEALAAWLRQRPAARIAIEGHADERGTREYNMALGERRAVALRNALIDRGVTQTQIAETISYGKERPAVVGSIESAWAQNRRAVMVPQ